MNFDLPIEQLVKRADTRFQLGFAREARERIPATDGFALSASSRGEAPLIRLLGLPAELNRITSGTARYWIVLSHYALVTRDPGGRAA